MTQTHRIDHTAARHLPPPLDSETLTLLRLALTPILDHAQSWDALARGLSARGFGLAFRDGRMVILNDSGAALCTGRCLGHPLRALSARLGRPAIRAGRDGRSGQLH